jgi:hypothetical protein
MILILTVAAASVIGIALTGFYPGIIVLLLLTLVPITSTFYTKKILSKSNVFQGNYYLVLPNSQTLPDAFAHNASGPGIV